MEQYMIKILIILIYLSNKAFNAVINYLDRSYLKKELPDTSFLSRCFSRGSVTWRSSGARLPFLP